MNHTKDSLALHLSGGRCSVIKLCLTLCDPTDWNPPGSSVHEISQARILEWVAISFSKGSSWPRDWTCVSCIGRRILHAEPPGKSIWVVTGQWFWTEREERFYTYPRNFPGGSDAKESACSAGDIGLIPGLGRSPVKGNAYPFQYSCLENPMDRGAWWATTACGVAESENNWAHTYTWDIWPRLETF